MPEVSEMRVTRWKSSKRGIKPKVAPMSKLIDCEPESISTEEQFLRGKIGRKTACFTVESLPDMPIDTASANAKAWLEYSKHVMHQYLNGGGHGSYKLRVFASVEQSLPVINVPRGTMIGCAEGKVINRPKGSVYGGRNQMDSNTVYGAMCPWPRT